jgi:hypothetical protein
MTDPTKRIRLEDASSRIKITIRELEQEIGINESAPINMALLQALAEVEKLSGRED